MTAEPYRARGGPGEDDLLWSVVLPVRPFGSAKQRLALHSGRHHAELAHAFYLDTLRAVRATPGVGLVLVVTDDPLAARQARTLGAATTPEGRRAGPDAAALAGAAALAPDCPVAVLAADLPTLRPEELAEALAAARRHRRARVADHTGAGTTAVTALRAADLVPSFGRAAESREPVLAAGPGLRLDVDTPADLARARVRGLGLFSAAVLDTWVRPSAARSRRRTEPDLPALRARR
ncbi:NTP transferase domain-containing protein [Streptomyces sp. BE20]|uniref:NTP transferase domain-containing protein n=1 Tax=Streptomycetaceae TaxID=2062 RepID=UPI002E78C753|nr:NTP transferase domain-containing protein [Streptomyces sp. BE20]MEE1828576.1 NTP transferase domain-containing protein [Streptomyces sp. BE20]